MLISTPHPFESACIHLIPLFAQKKTHGIAKDKKNSIKKPFLDRKQ